MRKIHADRRSFSEDRVSGSVIRFSQEFWTQPQRLISRMTHPEHPLVATHRTDAPADLVGERLECQPMIGSREGTGYGIAWAAGGLNFQERLDRFFEAALQQMLGHSSIVTTQRYARLSDDVVMREAKRLETATR
jgi:hypothetical protein